MSPQYADAAEQERAEDLADRFAFWLEEAECHNLPFHTHKDMVAAILEELKKSGARFLGADSK